LNSLAAEPAEHAEISYEPETSASSASSAVVLIRRRHAAGWCAIGYSTGSHDALTIVLRSV